MASGSCLSQRGPDLLHPLWADPQFLGGHHPEGVVPDPGDYGPELFNLFIGVVEPLAEKDPQLELPLVLLAEPDDALGLLFGGEAQLRQRPVVFPEAFLIDDAEGAHHFFALTGHLHMAVDAQQVAVGDQPHRQAMSVDAVDDLPQVDVGQNVALAVEFHDIRLVLGDLRPQAGQGVLCRAEVVPLALIFRPPPGAYHAVEDTGLFRLDVHGQHSAAILIRLDHIILLKSKIVHLPNSSSSSVTPG